MIGRCAFLGVVTVVISSVLSAEAFVPKSNLDVWHGAEWIVHPAEHDGAARIGEHLLTGGYRFRRCFFLDNRRITKAIAKVCGLGAYRLFVNGACVDRTYLSPGWSEYLRQIRYDEIEVTNILRAGTTNVVGIQTAPGYGQDWREYDAAWRAPQRALCALEIVKEDGSTVVVKSDASWESKVVPELVYASIYHGERVDRRLCAPNWCDADDGAKDWCSAKVVSHLGGELFANQGPPVRACEVFEPVRIKKIREGHYLVDFGVNIAGGVRLRVEGSSGSEVVVRHAEECREDFSGLDARTNGKALQTDSYVLSGEGVEILEPEWRYSGFRYAEISGLECGLTRTNVEAFAVHADLRATAEFSSSNKQLNWLWRTAKRTMLGNLQTIPTDTPVRDERTCCLMDTHAYWDLASMAFDMRMYSRWWMDHIAKSLLDIRGRPKSRVHALDRQYVGQRGNPDWSGVRIQLPWWNYMIYGDLETLKKAYPSMCEFCDFILRNRVMDGVLREGYGDWCAPMSDGGYVMCRAPFTNTALWIHLLDIMAEVAEKIGRLEDVARWRTVHNESRQAARRVFYRPEIHAFDDASQTAGVLALAFNLVDGDERTAVFDSLTNRIVSVDRYGTDTGIFGTKYLPSVLVDGGAVDLWMKMLTERNRLGFGREFAQGATTFWEQWKGSGSMCTHNHVMFSGAAEALISRFAGIRPKSPGFRTILIHPSFPASVDWVSCALETVVGRVAVHWRRNGSSIEFEFDVPSGSTAEVCIPGRATKLLQGGHHVMSVTE